MATLTEGKHEGEFIGELAMGIGYHVEKGTVLSGENLVAGAVVGDVPGGTSSSAAKTGGNTGTGTCVLDATTPILARAEEGVYTVRFTTATNMRLEGPDGSVLGDITIGGANGNSATISEQIKAVVTQASTVFVAGDGFDITISDLTAKVAEYDPAATDGSQMVGGILMQDTDASSGDAACTVFRRGPAIVNANDITFKTGLSAAQIATAKAALMDLGIKAV